MSRGAPKPHPICSHPKGKSNSHETPALAAADYLRHFLHSFACKSAQTSWHSGIECSRFRLALSPAQLGDLRSASEGGKLRRHSRRPGPSASHLPHRPCCSQHLLFDPPAAPIINWI